VNFWTPTINAVRLWAYFCYQIRVCLIS